VSAIASVTAQVQELHAHSYPTPIKTNAATSDLEDAVRQYLSDDSQRVLVAVRANVVVGFGGAHCEARHLYESRGSAVEREVRWLIPSEQSETKAPVL